MGRRQLLGVAAMPDEYPTQRLIAYKAYCMFVCLL